MKQFSWCLSSMPKTSVIPQHHTQLDVVVLACNPINLEVTKIFLKT